MIGRKLAEDRKLKVGDPLPLKGDVYPFDLNLTVRGIYDGPRNRDLRMCLFHWDYLDEGLKTRRRTGQDVGQRRDHRRQVQGRPTSWPALAQEDRRRLPQQRHPDADADRGGVRQDVRRRCSATSRG